jgi:hypothetical protein
LVLRTNQGSFYWFSKPWGNFRQGSGIHRAKNAISGAFTNLALDFQAFWVHLPKFVF